LGIGLVLAIVFVFLRLPFFIHDEVAAQSTVYIDKNGQNLFFDLSEKNDFYLPLENNDNIPQSCISALLIREDQRFYHHNGIDTISVLRAVKDNLTHGRVVSGGSTITQQVAKLKKESKNRSLKTKAYEAMYSLQLERHYTKDEIMTMWFNHASFGHNIRGIRAAAKIYFHTEVQLLSPAQCLYLMAIPQNPARYSPIKNHNAVRARAQQTARLLKAKKMIGNPEYDEILASKITQPNRNNHLRAPHFLMAVRNQATDQALIRTSLELSLQQKLEGIIQKHLALLSAYNVNNAAAVVIENRTGAVRGYVGNRDYYSSRTDGKNDILQSYRQVGSTLKPLIFALAFRDLGWNSETMIYDQPSSFATETGSGFSPKNIDHQYLGAITVREALANSRNTTAVSTFEKITPAALFRLFEQLDITPLQDRFDVGLSGALGTAELKPIDLVKLYVALANSGLERNLCFIEPCFINNNSSILPNTIADQITDILRDNTARVHAFGEKSVLNLPVEVAVKTGTTRNFKDNYTIGYSPEYTVLVWVGNANGEPMRKITGVTGAGPIFYDIMNFLSQDAVSTKLRRPEIIIQESGQSQGDLRVLSPLPNSIYTIDRERPLEQQKIKLEANADAEFFVDDLLIGTGKTAYWMPTSGRHIIKITTEEQEIRRQITILGKE
jgi:penicillin-binding protein 1C